MSSDLTGYAGEIHGTVAPGFEAVADVFAANFAERGEVGAAFAATLDGEPVVDLWGGVADSTAGRPWEQDTAVVVFSGTKGMVALCLLMLAERGQLDLEAPVANYWPEFAANGKERVRVIEVASHQARLPALRTPVGEGDLLDGARLATLLAAQPQEQDTRTIPFVYHPLTYGWLCGELVRRVDGRTIGRFFAEEVAGPLGLDAWIGIDGALEPRVARLEYGPGMDAAQADPDADELQAAIRCNPEICPASDRDLPWNRRVIHQAEIPGAGGIGTARALARMYGALARGGALDGLQLVSAPLLTRARHRLVGGDTFDSGVSLSFGIGFMVQDEAAFLLGPPADAFGHIGLGGSVHGAWPTERVGFSYAMNQMRHTFPDTRADPLLGALHRAVTGR